MKVVVDEEVKVVVVVEVAAVVAEINKVIGMVLVTQQRILIHKVSNALTVCR